VADIEQIFTEQGGVFCTPYDSLRTKVQRVRAFLFDWDGVFNDGTKDEQGSSSFSEIDAMGTNLLRFAYHLKTDKMPVVAIMSGEHNTMSFQLGRREHVHAIYYRVNNKRLAFDHFMRLHGLTPEEVAFVFDDVLDLGVCERCGVRLMVNRAANPLFNNYVVQNNLADYVTAKPGGQFAVREVTELVMGLYGNYDDAVKHRSHFSDRYDTYLKARQQIETRFFTLKEEIVEDTPKDFL
jgi:3-deoxy-D-manno-octulosonate 8-phosphate phosphatase (KDO 8-P phosphatase)